MKLINVFCLLVMVVTLMGCHENKCINVLDESNREISPVRMYLLSSEEYFSEITNTNPILLGDGKGVLIGEGRNGEVCFSDEKEGLLGGYYKVVAPHLTYKDAFKYYPSFDDIPDVIIFSSGKKVK